MTLDIIKRSSSFTDTFFQNYSWGSTSPINKQAQIFKFCYILNGQIITLKFNGHVNLHGFGFPNIDYSAFLLTK